MIAGYLYPLSSSLYPKGYQVTITVFIVQDKILDGRITSLEVIASRLNGFLYPSMPRLYPAGVQLSKSNFLAENLYLSTTISPVTFAVTYEFITSGLQSSAGIDSISLVYITLFSLNSHTSDINISDLDLFCNPTIFEPERTGQSSNLDTDITLLPSYLLPSSKSFGITISFQQADEPLRESSYIWQKGINIDKKIEQAPVPVAERDKPKLLIWNEKLTIDANKHLGTSNFYNRLDSNKILLVGPLTFYDLIKLITIDQVLNHDRNIFLSVNTPQPYDNAKISSWNLLFPVDRELDLVVSLLSPSERYMLLPWGKEFTIVCQKVYNPPDDLEFLLSDVVLNLEKSKCKIKLYPNASKLYSQEVIPVIIETLKIK